MFTSKFARHPLLILTLLSTFGGECQEYLEARKQREPEVYDLVIFGHVEDQLKKLSQSKEILRARIPTLPATVAPGNDSRPCKIPKSYSTNQFLFLGAGMPANDWEIPPALQDAINARETFLKQLKAAQRSVEFDRIMASEQGRELGDPARGFTDAARYLIIIATQYAPARVIDEPHDTLYAEYEPGSMVGSAFLFDPSALDFVCATRFSAENLMRVESRGEDAQPVNGAGRGTKKAALRGYAPDDARTFLARELETNAVLAISQTMRPAVSIPKPAPAAPAKQ